MPLASLAPEATVRRRTLFVVAAVRIDNHEKLGNLARNFRSLEGLSHKRINSVS